MNRCSKKIITFLVFVALTLSTLPVLQAMPDKGIPPAELVAKHLKGNCTVTAKIGGVGQAEGQAVMVSQGNQNLITLTFNSEDPPTWFKFDGSKASVSQFRPGRRTQLEQFFAAYDVIVKEGLVGGTLSASWPLLKLQERNPKLEYAGLKKINGKELHALKYTPRKGSDLKIILYFDPQTFRHVRTEYSQTIYATEQRKIGGTGRSLPDPTMQLASTARVDAYEEFADFKTEGGLELPHMYKFELSIQSEVKPAMVNWVFNLNDFNLNAPIDAAEFTSSSIVPKEKSN